jgi:hypothetical protein
MEELQRMAMSGPADLQTLRSELLISQVKYIIRGNRVLTIRDVEEFGIPIVT